MTAATLPPIVKCSERLLVEVEQAVRRWPRYVKYTHGSRLRDQAMEVCATAHRAFRDKDRRGEWVEKLVWSVDELKLSLQLGSRVKAFVSFAQFEAIMRTADDLGRQTGGLHRRFRSKGQNAGAGDARPQRAMILSASSASAREAMV